MDNFFYIQWHITDICNLRCRHCYQESFSRTNELSFNELKRILKNITSTMNQLDKYLIINITGGEPFLKKELFQLLEILEKEDRIQELSVITNGTLLNPSLLKQVAELKKLKYLKISIDGAYKKTNDDIRGGGNFKKVIENIKLVRENYDIKVVFMFTMMKRNYREIPQLINLAESLKASGIILERFIPLGTGKTIKDEVLSKKDWEEVLRLLSSIYSLEKISELASYHAFYIRFYSHEQELLGAKCAIGRDGLCIMPDGSVFPCRRLPISVGNLLNETLGEIWKNSELFTKLTDKNSIAGKCRKCAHDDCSGCRSIAYALTGDFLSEDPLCLL